MDTATPAIVLLAAGESRRFGGIKQLVNLGDEPMLRRVARSALGVGVPVIVVLGAHAARIRPVIADLALHVVENRHWQEGMGSSIACAMRALDERVPNASCMLLMLADQPRVGRADTRRLLDRHARMPSSIIASAHRDRPGPPVVFPRDCFETLAACRGPEGARAVLVQQRARVVLEHAIDPLDVDTPADLARAEQASPAHRPVAD